MELLNQMDGFDVLGKVCVKLCLPMHMEIVDNETSNVFSIKPNKKSPGENDHGNQQT